MDRGSKENGKQASGNDSGRTKQLRLVVDQARKA